MFDFSGCEHPMVEAVIFWLVMGVSSVVFVSLVVEGVKKVTKLIRG